MVRRALPRLGSSRPPRRAMTVPPQQRRSGTRGGLRRARVKICHMFLRNKLRSFCVLLALYLLGSGTGHGCFYTLWLKVSLQSTRANRRACLWRRSEKLSNSAGGRARRLAGWRGPWTPRASRASVSGTISMSYLPYDDGGLGAWAPCQHILPSGRPTAWLMLVPSATPPRISGERGWGAPTARGSDRLARSHR